MRVGFVGLGNIGQPMARALLRAGFQLTVLDRDPAKAGPCAEEGAREATGPAELADSDVVALAVPDDAAVNAVLAPPDGLLAALRSGSTVLVHSTVLPMTARRLAEVAAERGVGLLDAPVSGGSDRALRGELTVLVGGDRAVLDRVRPVLDAVGSDVRLVGPAGAGAATKLANQLMMFSALAGAHEALALAAAYKVDEQVVLDAVCTATGDSWAARNWGFFDRVAAAYDAAGTPVADRPWGKDLGEVIAAARAVGLSLPVATVLAEHVAEQVESHARRVRE